MTLTPTRPAPRLALAAAATLALAAGCTLNRGDSRRSDDASPGLFGNRNSQLIEPKRCELTVVILPRPLHDKVVNESVWSGTDEQVLPPDVRKALAANGLRIGVLTGGLPAEVEAAVQAPPPNKIDPARFLLPDGVNTLVSLTDTQPAASLLLNRDGRAFGKDYKDAAGFFRVTATQEGPVGVGLRLVPEIHHGPMARRFDALPTAAGAPQSLQFMLKDGQQEDTLRELAASLTLQPGQVAVLGCDPDRRGSLGSFLFTQPEVNSDRLLQKVVFVWAARTNNGVPGSQPTPASPLVPVEPPELALPIPREKGKDRELTKEELAASRAQPPQDGAVAPTSARPPEAPAPPR